MPHQKTAEPQWNKQLLHPCLWLGVKEDLTRRLLGHFKSASACACAWANQCLKKAEQATTTCASLSLKEQLRFAFIIDKDLHSLICAVLFSKRQRDVCMGLHREIS